MSILRKEARGQCAYCRQNQTDMKTGIFSSFSSSSCTCRALIPLPSLISLLLTSLQTTLMKSLLAKILFNIKKMLYKQESENSLFLWPKRLRLVHAQCLATGDIKELFILFHLILWCSAKCEKNWHCK